MRLTLNVALAAATVLLSHCDRKVESPTSLDDPAARLLAGNTRFYTGHPAHPNISIERVRSLAKEQHPFAIIVGCSDSRAPDEIIFDQGLGDLFVIRTAGNVIADIGLGSIEYATENLKVKYILVLGHQGCGAVKAFAEHAHPQNHIKTILDTLVNELEVKHIVRDTVDANYLSDVVKANVIHQVNKITHSSKATEEKIQRGEIVVQGGVYDISNGRVSFLTK